MTRCSPAHTRGAVSQSVAARERPAPQHTPYTAAARTSGGDVLMARRSLIRRSIAADVEPDGLVIVTAHTSDGTCASLPRQRSALANAIAHGLRDPLT